jgi:hypothetical protein
MRMIIKIKTISFFLTQARHEGGGLSGCYPSSELIDCLILIKFFQSILGISAHHGRGFSDITKEFFDTIKKAPRTGGILTLYGLG